MFEKEIFVKNSKVDNLLECIYPEYESLSAKRFRYKVKKQNDGILFKISADDNVALKTAISSIEKLVRIFEKVSNLNCGENV